MNERSVGSSLKPHLLDRLLLGVSGSELNASAERGLGAPIDDPNVSVLDVSLISLLNMKLSLTISTIHIRTRSRDFYWSTTVTGCLT